MVREFGIIQTKDLQLPHSDLVECIRSHIAEFSYDLTNPPDFQGLFGFLVTRFADCDDLEIIRDMVDLLAQIAGYKLGVAVVHIFTRVAPLALRLLASGTVNNTKSAVDYFRKIARAIGPRLVLSQFVAPNSSNRACQRGLGVIVHQSIADSPEFHFVSADFDGWVQNLVSLVGIGPRIRDLLRERLPSTDFLDPISDPRPPTVPPVFRPFPAPSGDNPVAKIVHPSSARPVNPRRLLGDGSSVYNLTTRQQQIREFVDEPFAAGEKIVAVVAQARRGLEQKDWEEKTASFNASKRILRYCPDAMSDDDIHELVTAVLDSLGSPQTALVFSALGALEEAFKMRTGTMEYELGRILPSILKLHQKTAQFFEAPLSQCFDVLVEAIPVKRFLAVLISSEGTKSTRVQAAAARYCRDSLAKQGRTNEKMFVKGSSELSDLIKMISRLLSGATSETREAARDSSRLLGAIYGDQFPGIVQRVLEARDAAEFLRVS
jgi:hypothetical protein